MPVVAFSVFVNFDTFHLYSNPAVGAKGLPHSSGDSCHPTKCCIWRKICSAGKSKVEEEKRGGIRAANMGCDLQSASLSEMWWSKQKAWSFTTKRVGKIHLCMVWDDVMGRGIFLGGKLHLLQLVFTSIIQISSSLSRSNLSLEIFSMTAFIFVFLRKKTLKINLASSLLEFLKPKLLFHRSQFFLT